MTTADQRHQALEHANQAREQAATLKAEIKYAGRRAGANLAAREVVAGESSIRFVGLLLAVPKVGPDKALRMLAKARINPESRVNSKMIDGRRRQELADLLVAHAWRIGRS